MKRITVLRALRYDQRNDTEEETIETPVSRRFLCVRQETKIQRREYPEIEIVGVSKEIADWRWLPLGHDHGQSNQEIQMRMILRCVVYDENEDLPMRYRMPSNRKMSPRIHATSYVTAYIKSDSSARSVAMVLTYGIKKLEAVVERREQLGWTTSGEWTVEANGSRHQISEVPFFIRSLLEWIEQNEEETMR